MPSKALDLVCRATLLEYPKREILPSHACVMFATAGMWAEVARVRELMDKLSLTIADAHGEEPLKQALLKLMVDSGKDALIDDAEKYVLTVFVSI